MAKYQIKKGSTDRSIYIFIQDSSQTDGRGKTALAFDTASLVCYYVRPLGSATALTLVTQTVTGAHADGGFVEVSSANMPGVYRLDLSDAIIASGVPSVFLMLKGASNMAALPIEIELTDTDNQDAVRGGMTSLPNAAAEAAGGLYTRGTGAGQINQPANGMIDVNAVRLLGTAIASPATAGVLDVNVKNINNVVAATPGASGGVLIAGTNAATTVNITGDITGNLSGSVGSVTGNVGGNVVGTVASVVGAVGSVTGAVGSVTGSVGSVAGNVGGNVVGTVASVVGNVGGNVVGTVASVVGNVGGNVVGTVASVVGNVGGSVASVVGLTASNLDTTISSRLAASSYTAPNNAGIAAIDLRLPASPAAVSDIPTAAENATELFDQADGIETGFTFRESQRLQLSAAAGKITDANTANPKIRDVNDSKNRISATVDATGRTAVSYDLT